jgi:hypothetical protein
MPQRRRSCFCSPRPDDLAEQSLNGAAQYGSKKALLYRIWTRYRLAHGRAPNLLRPRRYTEKIQWRKCFDHNPAFTMLCDKLAVRAFIAKRIGPEHLAELLWSGVPADLPFDALQPPYVLKSNHASGQVVIIRPGDTIDPTALRQTAAGWLAVNYGLESDEPGYQRVPRRLMIERTITTPSGAAPQERRLFVFHGKVAVINTVFVEDGRVRNGAFHTPDWRRLNWYFSRYLQSEFPEPRRLREMILAAERLGAGFDHIRVDLYDCDTQFYVGEISLYSWSGVSRFTPDEADFELGAHWRLRLPQMRAAAAMLRHGLKPAFRCASLRKPAVLH